MPGLSPALKLTEALSLAAPAPQLPVEAMLFAQESSAASRLSVLGLPFPDVVGWLCC